MSRILRMISPKRPPGGEGRARPGLAVRVKQWSSRTARVAIGAAYRIRTPQKRAPTGGALSNCHAPQGSADLAQQGRHAVLGVAIEHPRVLLEEQRVLDSRIASALTPLRDK